MLKLTLTGPDRLPIFVNPRAIASIAPRKVQGCPVGGCCINCGGEDINVVESAEDVAIEVAEASEAYRIVDVAQNARERADAEKAREARVASGECKAPAVCACPDCIPF